MSRHPQSGVQVLAGASGSNGPLLFPFVSAEAVTGAAQASQAPTGDSSQPNWHHTTSGAQTPVTVDLALRTQNITITALERMLKTQSQQDLSRRRAVIWSLTASLPLAGFFWGMGIVSWTSGAFLHPTFWWALASGASGVAASELSRLLGSG